MSDVWAFGVTLWEIYNFGQTPYSTLEDEDVLNEVLKGLTLEVPEACPESIKNLMKSCWQFEATKRCTFQEIHGILENIDHIEQTDGYLRMKPARSTANII